MECPICAALHREHSQECEAEAAATIKQRSQSLFYPQGAAHRAEHLDPIVLKSRKRQAHIAFQLDQHRAQDHPVKEKDQAATA